MPPIRTLTPATDTENAEYNSSRAPNSTTHSVDSYNSNSDRSPDENRSESVIRDTGALFGQEIPRRSTTLSSDSTADGESDKDNHNMPSRADGVPTPIQPQHGGGGVPQLQLHTGVLHGRVHGVKRRGSDIDDTSRVGVGQSSRSGASRVRNTARFNPDNTEDEGTNAQRYGAGWAVTESPTHVSEYARDREGSVSDGTAGPDDSDDEGKSKGSKTRDSTTPTR